MAANRNTWKLALVAALSLGAASNARAGSPLSLTPNYLDDDTTAPADDAGSPGLLTQGLDRIGLGDAMKNAHVQASGYADVSWSHSLSSPSSHVLDDRSFDFENDDVTFNGVALQLERTVDATHGKYDIGARLDMLYGGDARFTHSNGMLDNRGFAFDATTDGDTGPDEQFDITQAYIEFALPWGNGLTLNVGKFVTPIGYEYVDPTKNTLYSHGYLFNFGGPYSQTGFTAKYALNNQWNVVAGLTRGWDQSLQDNNGAIDFLGQIEYKPDSVWDALLTISVGPQQDDAYGYRTELDALLYYTPEGKWQVGGEAMYGIEADVPGSGDDYSQWYGAAVYPTYKLCNHMSINGRLEWFNDADGVRGVGANNAFEATLGVTFYPLVDSNAVGNTFRIRPEIRYDYTDSATFDGGSSYSQTTFAVDALLAF